MVKQHTNAHSLEGDSLISTIKEIPVAAQVTQLLDYAKNYQYSNPELSAELVEYSLELAESVGDPLLLSNVLNARAIMNFYSGNNRESKSEILELTIAQRIWGFILELIELIKDYFDIDTNELIVRIMKSDNKNNKIINLLQYQHLKAA